MAPNRIWTLADLGKAAVDLQRLRLHCKVDSSDEDALLQTYALAATLHVEQASQRVLVRRSAVLRVAKLPLGRAPLELPGGTVASVTSMTVEGTPFTAFEVIGDSPARMVPDAEWPSVAQDGYPVSVAYVVGPAIPPADLAMATFLLAAEMYARRSEGTLDTVSIVPVGAAELIKKRRIRPR